MAGEASTQPPEPPVLGAWSPPRPLPPRCQEVYFPPLLGLVLREARGSICPADVWAQTGLRPRRATLGGSSGSPSKVLSQREPRGLTPWSPCHWLPPANVLLGLRPLLQLLVISAVAKTLPLTLIFLCKVTRQTVSSSGLWPVSWEV